MAKYIVKVDKAQRCFRVNIPRKIIQHNLWGDVSHVLVEYCSPGQIVVRRLIDGKTLETEDS